MKRLFIYIAFAATGFCMPSLSAQTTEKKPEEKEEKLTAYQKSLKEELEKIKQRKLESLEQEKNNIAENEKFELKKVLGEINSKLEAGSITPEQAQQMKEEAAKNAALNIDSKIALIEAQAELVRRDVKYNFTPYAGAYLEVGFGNAYDDAGSFLFGLNYKTENKKLKYDKRTYTDVVFAIGWNNTVGGGQTIGDSYSFGKSASAEIGFTFRTRLLKNSNKVRLAYGLSFQQNVLSPKNNKYFVNDNGTTILEEFPYNLKRNELAMSNLIAPFFFEFGPSRKREYKDYFRYDTSDQFKVGIGGYVGVNLATTQRLKYKAEGERIMDRLRKDYNVTPFVYGVSAYVGMGPLSIFAKYELNTVFENSTHKDHNILFGFRTDL